jgi:hypothetical protein
MQLFAKAFVAVLRDENGRNQSYGRQASTPSSRYVVLLLLVLLNFYYSSTCILELLVMLGQGRLL